MTPRSFTPIILFISAYSPLFLIFTVKDWDFCNNKFEHPWQIYSLLAVTIASVIVLLLIFRFLNKGNRCVTVKSVSNRSMDLINYTIPYILSFCSFDLAKPADAISLGIFLLILFILTVRSHSIFMNPVLAIIGYGLYDIEFEYDSKVKSSIVLAKFDLHLNQRYYMRPLTPYLQVIMAEEENDREHI